VIKIASPKKNKNNPDNKSNGINGKDNGNGSNNIKQNKLRSSEYCEKNCNDFGECQKYKDYILRMLCCTSEDTALCVISNLIFCD